MFGSGSVGKLCIFVGPSFCYRGPALPVFMLFCAAGDEPQLIHNLGGTPEGLRSSDIRLWAQDDGSQCRVGAACICFCGKPGKPEITAF